VPARIIAAADDPMIPADDLARLAPDAPLSISLAPHGGHCGFVTRLGGPSWIAAEIVRELGTARATAASARTA
jgi:predicted alpha/beta-fold hydrolase